MSQELLTDESTDEQVMLSRFPASVYESCKATKRG